MAEVGYDTGYNVADPVAAPENPTPIEAHYATLADRLKLPFEYFENMRYDKLLWYSGFYSGLDRGMNNKIERNRSNKFK